MKKPTRRRSRKRHIHTPHCLKLKAAWRFYFFTVGTIILLVIGGHVIPEHWRVGIEGGIIGLATKLGEGFRGEA